MKVEKSETIKSCESCKFARPFYTWEYKSFRCLNNYSKYYEQFKGKDFKCDKWSKK